LKASDEVQAQVVVIGAGQAGLATSYHLKRLGIEHLVLEGGARVGDVWRSRWDSLRLFTPALHDGLPGLPFPAPAKSFPGKEDVADYLDDYAERNHLPVRLNTRVTRIEPSVGGFDLETAGGTLRAGSVIVAAGPNGTPWVPPIATDLSAAIFQLHSANYRGPKDIPPGPVLVVGAGTSGVALALELSQTHPVSIAGRPTAHIPDKVLRFAGGPYWRFISSVLTIKTPIGRKVASKFHDRGAPLLGVGIEDLQRAGVAMHPRLTSVVNGQPILEDGGAPAVSSVIWATGYRPAFDWIANLPTTKAGWPATDRGVVSTSPGLYFVGMPFQYALTSGLIGGVGRDAAYVAAQIATRHVGQPSGARVVSTG
jgi:putative flavoprotein involved in K+ transport